MSLMVDYRLISVQVGDLLKSSTGVNELNRFGQAIFPFVCEIFPNEAITSIRATIIQNWILSLAKQNMDNDRRLKLLIKFCHSITDDESRKKVDDILVKAGVPHEVLYKEDHSLFISRDFHPEVHKHTLTLFLQGNYFHAVFEASKVYNTLVKQKSLSQKDGSSLMLEVWGCEKGVLKITNCESQTDHDVQDGIKFLSAGLMEAIRNPTAHEPALLWPINRQDCLDILSFISFLFRKLDQATYFKL
jgi:uncharacterized protein (TIGR02391 family)